MGEQKTADYSKKHLPTSLRTYRFESPAEILLKIQFLSGVSSCELASI